MPYQFKVIPVLLGLLLLNACIPNPASPAPTAAIPALLNTAPATIPSPTNTLLPSTPSHTSLPPTPTQGTIPEMTIPATPGKIGPFQFVTSLPSSMGGPGELVDVYAPEDGSVWVIASGVIWRWGGQTAWIPPKPDSDLLTTVDDQGKFWSVNKTSGEVITWKDGELTTYPVSGWKSQSSFEENWWNPEVRTIIPAGESSIWVPSAQDVRFFDGSTWRVYSVDDMGFPIPETEDIGIVNQIALAPNFAQTWIAQCYYSAPGPMGGAGVRWFDGQAWQGAGSPVDSECVSALAIDPAGDVWLGASTTIWHVEHNGQSWTDYHLPDELLSTYSFAHPLQVSVDGSGDVWVGMQMCGGASCDVAARLYRIHDGEWSLIVEAEYWSSSFKELLLDRSGNAWLFWEGMVYRLNDTPSEPIAKLDVRGVASRKDGSIWAVAGNNSSLSLWVYQP